MKIYIFIDDEREEMFNKIATKVGYKYIHCHSYETAIGCIELYKDSKLILDFDHDLGLGKTGYDVAKYIIENDIAIEGFKIHSMNPVGVSNIRQLLTHYNRKEIN